MRHLTIALCLTLVVLLGSAGEGTAQSNLPPCPEDQSMYLTDCFGSYNYPNGEKYVGEWEDDTPHGHGTYTWTDGEYFVGEFDGGQQYHGTQYAEDGTTIGSRFFKFF